MTTASFPPAPPRFVADGNGAPAAVYAERAARFGRERDAVTRRWSRTADLLLVLFVAAAAGLGWGILARMPLLIVAGGVLFVGYGALALHHGSLGAARRRYTELAAINDEAGRRLARDWDGLPLRHVTRGDPGHAYAVDLDLFGRASLFHLLQPAMTPFGEATLARWLLRPAAPETITARQVAAAELAPLLDFREELAIGARRMDAVKTDPEPFLAWAESEPWLRGMRASVWAARSSTVLLWVLFVLHVARVVPYPLWLPFLAANVILHAALGGRAYRTLAGVWQQEGAFRHYAELFRLISSTRFQSGELRGVTEGLTAGGLTAEQQMRRLNRLTSLAIPRSAPLYWPVQIATLWDIHALALLEGWQVVVGGRVRGWLTALGEAESLAALGGLAYDNPTWAFPAIDHDARSIDARELGHPLLSEEARVVNDVTVGPAGAVLLVTGSNMSGKSTLLRTIGVNLVLAGAGAPVCAASFRSPPVELWTSMRVQDSLEQGVSYFMAELQRLKAVVDAARANAASGDRCFVYLLDEILQGTNTAERQIAARRIIGHLAGLDTLGAVSTHDLTLAESPELTAIVRPIHFSETFTEGSDGPSMTFDYTIRPGIATSTNALRLMEIVGLDLE